MPTDKLDVSNLYITDPETGQETKMDTIPTLTMTTDAGVNHEPIKAFEPPREITGTFEIKNMKALRELLYKSFTVSGSIDEMVREVFLNMPLGREVVDLEFKQNKTHKKKRINKKYAKKYGYTCKVYYVEG